MDIMTALAALSHALDGVKKLRDIEKGFDAVTYKLQITDLASSLADAKMGLMDVQQEMASKDAEIARLKDAMRFHGECVSKDGFLYEKGTDDQPKGNPFCPVCIASDGVHIRLAEDPKGIVDNAFCPRCKASFGLVTRRHTR